MARVVAPGEVVQPTPQSGQLRLGPGLVSADARIVATRCGVLRQSKGGEGQLIYIPAEGEVVIGTVLDRQGENFLVDIGGPFAAQLPQLSFEGATRRNRPAIKAGDLVYARVISAPRDAEPVLSCVDALGRAAGFGHLKGGLQAKVTTSAARTLLASPPPAVLRALGESLQFEMAVGLNGRVWVCGAQRAGGQDEDAAAQRTAILVVNAVTASEFLTDQQSMTLVHRLLNRASKS